jgi:hypothetical protein
MMVAELSCQLQRAVGVPACLCLVTLSFCHLQRTLEGSVSGGVVA